MYFFIFASCEPFKQNKKKRNKTKQNKTNKQIHTQLTHPHPIREKQTGNKRRKEKRVAIYLIIKLMNLHYFTFFQRLPWIEWYVSEKKIYM